MPQLIVLIGKEERRISYEPGPSVREILEGGGAQVRTACRGHGACGLCEIRLLGGGTLEPTLNERLHLTRPRLARGVRLACQLRPQGDLRLEVLHAAPPSKWRGLSGEGFPSSAWPPAPWPVARLPEVKSPLGVAVDLGTTNIRLVLLKLTDGERLARLRGRNPQLSFGADVLTRLVAAQESPETARALNAQVVAAIAEGLAELAGRQGLDLRRVTSLAVVGNTPMLALMAGKNYQLLLQPQHWENPVACRPATSAPWVEAWGTHPQAAVRLIQPLAGFVGSDLLAGLVATRLLSGPAPAVFIDFGTNSEIALWDGRNLWITSAAGGPAFELWGLQSGMLAEPGAVHRVERGASGSLHYQVLGGEEPRGFCGSGLVDLITRLVETGQLSRTGRFAAAGAADPGGARLQIAPGIGSLVLSMADVDALQRAKAAIGAGLLVLGRHSGITLASLARVCVAGEFGRFLDVTSAQAIGLLPRVPADRVELSGDAALRGCGDLILSTAAQQHLAQLRRTARLISLAHAEDFEELFLANLYLEPLKED
ncbi:MAG: ASKHA domain-containing protein [Desulfobaccales bacterium]